MPDETAKESKRARGSADGVPSSSFIDLCFAALTLAVFAFWVIHFQYRNSLGGDDDVFRVLNGLMDGARMGTGLASPLHYGKSFSFGYILAMYHFVAPAVLRNTQPLTVLINDVGAISAIGGAVSFWFFVRLLYDVRVATIALMIFALSPMMLELGTTGHQILPAFAFFAAAAAFLFLPVNGWRFALCSAASTAMLILALLARAEVLLAFPFLALARPNLRSFRAFLRAALLYGVAPALSALVFFVLKHHYIDRFQKSELGTFVTVMSNLSSVPRGVLVYLLGCGFLTTFAGLYAAAKLSRDAVTAPHASDRRYAVLHAVIGPFTLILPSLCFWMLNPLPARHFLLCLAGMGMLIGVLLSTWHASRVTWAYTGALAIVVGNQLVAGLIGPTILKHYPSSFAVAPGAPPSMPMRVTVGSSLSYHRAVDAELHTTDLFAEKLLNSCDPKTLILTSREPQIISHLYEVSAPWVIENTRRGHFVEKAASANGRTIMVIWEPSNWPDDTAAEVLADPDLRDYKIADDPGSISIYDKAVIPADRLAHFDCAAPNMSN